MHAQFIHYFAINNRLYDFSREFFLFYFLSRNNFQKETLYRFSKIFSGKKADPFTMAGRHFSDGSGLIGGLF